MKFLRIIFGLIPEYFLIAQLKFAALLQTQPSKKFTEGFKGDIVIVYGFNEQWTFFRHVATKLHQDGFRIHFIPELNGLMPIAKSAHIVFDYIQSHNLTDVVLLSHSKGGLIAKYILDHLDTQQIISKSISVATPYQGSIWGYFHFFNLYEFKPNSTYLEKEGLIHTNDHKITQLYSTFDNHVIPHTNLILKGAQNILIDCIGHTRIMEDKRTYAEISKQMNNPTAD